MEIRNSLNLRWHSWFPPFMYGFHDLEIYDDKCQKKWLELLWSIIMIGDIPIIKCKWNEQNSGHLFLGCGSFSLPL